MSATRLGGNSAAPAAERKRRWALSVPKRVVEENLEDRGIEFDSRLTKRELAVVFAEKG